MFEPAIRLPIQYWSLFSRLVPWCTWLNDLGLFDDKEELDLDEPDFEVPVLGFGKDMVFWANKLALKQLQSSAIINGIGVIRFILRSDFFLTQWYIIHH